MRSEADQAFIQMLLDEQAIECLFVELDWSTPLRFTNLDIDYYFRGERYVSWEMGLGMIPSRLGLAVDRAELRLANPERHISSVLFAAQQRGRRASIWLGGISDERILTSGSGSAILDHNGAPILDHNGQPITGPGAVAYGQSHSLVGSAILFTGQLSNYETVDDYVELRCVNETIHWHRNLLRKAKAGCPWPFKGSECRYGGEAATCNQTYERCKALANDANFGGNRYLPAQQEEKEWWGRVYK